MPVSSALPIREIERHEDSVERDETGAGAPARVLNLAEAAGLVRCSRAHLSNVSMEKCMAFRDYQRCASVAASSFAANPSKNGFSKWSL
jgi:hypothetical protein